MVNELKLFNTLTRKLEKFEPIEKGVVKIYVCGPTVYDYIHIGNARPIIIFDCLRHYLEYIGFKVTYVQNFTDVDDKIIKRANEQNSSFEAVVEKYIAEYEIDAKGLLVQKPTVAPRVSENIESIVSFVEKLMEKGCAYESGGNVFFKTANFKNYGKLSKINLQDLKFGKRVKTSEFKESELDFVLWKAAKPGEPFWSSPWGNGRPGWHIECSVMASKFAAKTLDIHCGGRDLIFPHHENEIAQSESANGVKFSNFWLHNGYININSKKMSKSDGNFFTVRELANEFGYEVLRFLLIQAHYRTPINFSKDLIMQCAAALDRVRTFRSNLSFAIKKAETGAESVSLTQELAEFKSKFLQALDDDFNTADAIAVLFDLIRAMGDFVSLKVETSKQNLILISGLFDELVGVLKLINFEGEKENEVSDEVLNLFKKRQEARVAKNFDEADRLRREIEKLGFFVEETRKGSRLIKKSKFKTEN